MCDTLSETDTNLMSIDAATANQDEPTTNPKACLDTIQLAQSIMSEMDARAASDSFLQLPNFLEPLSPELEPSPIDESSPSDMFLDTLPESASLEQSSDDRFEDDAQVEPFQTTVTHHVGQIEPICFDAGHSGHVNGSSHFSTYLLDGIGHILMSDPSSDQSDDTDVTNTKSPADECRTGAHIAEPSIPQKLQLAVSNESSTTHEEEQRKTRRWKERFDELECFKTKNGHCNVTAQNSQHFPKLLRWIKRQRYHFKS